MANNYLICQLYHYLFLIALFQQIPKFITTVVPDLFFFGFFFFWLVIPTLLEKEMAAHSSILAWRNPLTEEPGGLQSTGPQ